MATDFLVSVGFDNYVAAGQVVAVISAASAPAKRLRDEAREAGRLVDACQGHRIRAIVVTASNHVIMCAAEGAELAASFNSAGSKRPAVPGVPAGCPDKASQAAAEPADEAGRDG
jgi:regulator of extracellular matrix RemA (YlzA/DUF370 family)